MKIKSVQNIIPHPADQAEFFTAKRIVKQPLLIPWSPHPIEQPCYLRLSPECLTELTGRYARCTSGSYQCIIDFARCQRKKQIIALDAVIRTTLMGIPHRARKFQIRPDTESVL